MILFWSNTPVYIALVSVLELLLEFFILFLGTTVYEGTIEEMKYGCNWASVSYISGMVCITICVKEVRIFLIFVYLWIPCFEVTLVGAFVSFLNLLSWVHYGFTWMVHDIFHAMFDRNKIRFCCVATETHGKILKVISSFNSDVHEYTNPVI